MSVVAGGVTVLAATLVGAESDGAVPLGAVAATLVANGMAAPRWWRGSPAGKLNRGAVSGVVAFAALTLAFMAIGYWAFGCTEAGPSGIDGYCAALEGLPRAAYSALVAFVVCAPLAIITGGCATTLTGKRAPLLVTSTVGLAGLAAIVLPFLLLS